MFTAPVAAPVLCGFSGFLRACVDFDTPLIDAGVAIEAVPFGRLTAITIRIEGRKFATCRAQEQKREKKPSQRGD